MNGNPLADEDGVGGSTFMDGVEVLTPDPIPTNQYGDFIAKLRNTNKKAVNVTLRLTAFDKDGQELDVYERLVRIPAKANFTRSLYVYNDSLFDDGGSIRSTAFVLMKITAVAIAK
jgi:hypothetical protein